MFPVTGLLSGTSPPFSICETSTRPTCCVYPRAADDATRHSWCLFLPGLLIFARSDRGTSRASIWSRGQMLPSRATLSASTDYAMVLGDRRARLGRDMARVRPFQILALSGTVDSCHDRYRFSSDHVSSRSDCHVSTYLPVWYA